MPHHPPPALASPLAVTPSSLSISQRALPQSRSRFESIALNARRSLSWAGEGEGTCGRLSGSIASLRLCVSAALRVAR
eukprot:1984746-Pleurochrysis_carterae.AAC.2